MRNLRGTYVHRGDGLRRRRRAKNALLAAGAVGALVLISWKRPPGEARAEPSRFSFSLGGESRRLRDELESTRGELDLATAQLERANRIIYFSSRYAIGADLAANIIDVASAEGIEPELAFRVVKVESEFNERATSPVGAIGLTQVMLPTARFFDRTMTAPKLYDRKTNLRIGFRYLRALIKENKGNVRLALLIYNRGPAAVNAARAMGADPANGYERMVMRGYKGKGVVD
jgi:soluble lytic murein transglycosylase-like protein